MKDSNCLLMHKKGHYSSRCSWDISASQWSISGRTISSCRNFCSSSSKSVKTGRSRSFIHSQKGDERKQVWLWAHASSGVKRFLVNKLRVFKIWSTKRKILCKNSNTVSWEQKLEMLCHLCHKECFTSLLEDAYIPLI